MTRYQSWGRFPKAAPTAVWPVYWTSDPVPFHALPKPALPFGCGRSYGDVCLNEPGVVIDTRRIDRFLAFDEARGVLRCESGVTLDQVLNTFVPRGWFLPVAPGTKQVTVGGAIANDVHGKNHHRTGTFGHHVQSLTLLRTNGERIVCSPVENADLFAATIGGLGLTGLILSAELQLRAVAGPFFKMSRSAFRSLTEFERHSTDWDEEFEYTVAWIDSHARGRKLGRGVLFAGNHAGDADGSRRRQTRHGVTIPFDFPSFALNRFTARAFNGVYFSTKSRGLSDKRVHYEPFLFPLDTIHNWNRIYGRHGFLQYQVVVPPDDALLVVRELLGRIVTSRLGAFLAVLKRFGDRKSAGMLSFPRPGWTLAVDMANRGKRTLALLDQLDTIVARANGVVYPAKDARMASSTFKRSFPNWERFATHIDPGFGSNFWRRVMNEAG